MEPLKRRDVHEAVEVICAAFDADPVWRLCFPSHPRFYPLRSVAVYMLFAAQIHFLHLRTTRVMRNAEGKIACVAIFEDEQLNPLLQMLGFIGQSFAQFYFMFAKIARVVFGSLNPLTFLAAIVYSVVSLFFGMFWVCFAFFAFNFIRSALSSAAYLRKDRWHAQKKKYLMVIATHPEEQGKGLGSKFVSAVFAELEGQKHYGGYYLESSNPRNVPFYLRNGFLSLGAANFCGLTITFMVKPDLHRPAGAQGEQA